MFLNALLKKLPQDSQTLYKHGLQSHAYIMLEYQLATSPHNNVKNITFPQILTNENGAGHPPPPPIPSAPSAKNIFFSVTPGKNKLFRKNEFLTNGRLHENRGVKLFSQLQDEHILSSSK